MPLELAFYLIERFKIAGVAVQLRPPEIELKIVPVK